MCAPSSRSAWQNPLFTGPAQGHHSGHSRQRNEHLMDDCVCGDRATEHRRERSTGEADKFGNGEG